MNKFFLVLTVVLIAVVGCASPPAHSKPEAVVNAAIDAWNAGDVDTLKSLFADDAVAYFPDWGDTETGAEEIGAWIEGLAAANFVIEPESIEVEGDTVTVVAKVWADPTRELGVAPLVTIDVYTAENGKITSQTSTLTEESAAKLMEAMAAAEFLSVVNATLDAWNAGDVDTLKALFADDAVACFPDWGGECTTGAEEIGAWIEELVAGNFVIEPESIEVEGDTVTVVAKVWADPTRELGVTPLVTMDVYTVQDSQITSQISTLTEESAAKLMAAMLPTITAVEDLVGVWESGRWLLEFTEDGGYRVKGTRMSTSMAAGEIWFEGSQLHFKDRPGFCEQDEIGRYELEGVPGDHLTLAVIADPCGARDATLTGQWTWVSD